MSRIYKTLKAQSKIAMAFIGRTYARLRHIQKLSKLRIDAVQLVVKNKIVAIYLDGRVLLQATRGSMTAREWDIHMTEQLKNILETQNNPI